MRQIECILQNKTVLTSDTALYQLQIVGPPISCIPGQFISLSIPDSQSGGRVVRAYSIAGFGEKPNIDASSHSVSSNIIELIVRHIPNGKGSSLLNGLQLGSTLSFLSPTGHLTVDNAFKHAHAVFIANATGIAPFRAMTQYFRDTQIYQNITILWGLRTIQDIYLFNEFAQYSKEWSLQKKSFQIFYCLSQEPSLPQHSPFDVANLRLGRVQSSFEILRGEDHMFFICGGKTFVLEVKAKLDTVFPGSEVCLERFN